MSAWGYFGIQQEVSPQGLTPTSQAYPVIRLTGKNTAREVLMTEVPIQWLKNQHALENPKSKLAAELFPAGLPQQVRRLHSDIPGYRMSPLKSLPRLAQMRAAGEKITTVGFDADNPLAFPKEIFKSGFQ